MHLNVGQRGRVHLNVGQRGRVHLNVRQEGRRVHPANTEQLDRPFLAVPQS